MEWKDALSDRVKHLKELRERRKKVQDDTRTDSRGYTMEGLKLGTLLKQLQALQAIQGLQELQPRKGKTHRYAFSEDPEERAKQRQWLTFKADWLDSLLEDTVAELEEMNRFEKTGQERKDETDSKENTR